MSVRRFWPNWRNCSNSSPGLDPHALEECVQLQRWVWAKTMGQLPEMKDKINWLVARVYEQDRKDVTLG